MERISRALELARAQRDNRIDPTVEWRNEAREQVRVEKNGVEKTVESNAAHSRLGDAPSQRSHEIELHATLREQERILPPGSTGPMGGPYKMLRTQVMKRLDQLSANSLAVISAASGAGKTLTAINLAISIASDSGRTALLVDFDLRNPNIHRRFGYAPKVGVEDCLANDRPLHEAMFKIAGYERLTVLAARERVSNSSELLRSQRAVELMIEMRTRYANRVLIFDLPPVLQADDALAFSRYVQAGLLVVGEGRSRRDDVTKTVELLHELPIVGTVLNGSRDDGRIYY